MAETESVAEPVELRRSGRIRKANAKTITFSEDEELFSESEEESFSEDEEDEESFSEDEESD